MDVEKQQPQSVPSDDAGTDDEILGGGDKLELQAKKEVHKLIEKNGAGGDTKIKIMEQEKTFSGMTKDELMKYANDPFWIRLRWFLFILFWVVWLAMLIGAVLIIVYAPKCAAPEKLSWWNRGPLVKVESPSDLPLDAVSLKQVDATGIVFMVPGEDTYDAEKLLLHKRSIEEMVAQSGNKDVKVIVDLVANYVTDKDELYLKGLVDKELRAPFVWVERATVPNNWIAIGGGAAWQQVKDSSYILSQFGANRYDLQMTNAVNKERLVKVIRDYAKLPSVCGFRLANTKHFIINPELRSEEPAGGATSSQFGHEDYKFWTHSQTTYVDGLSDLLGDLKAVALNATADHCESLFFGASDSIEFPERLAQSADRLTVESVPIKLNLFQAESRRDASRAIVQELSSLKQLRTERKLWAELQYSTATALSEQALFTFLLPGGVPVLNKQQLAEEEKSLKQWLDLRDSPAFMYGSFDVYQDTTESLVGYTRVKAGSPGFLVVYNPTGTAMKGNFNATGIETELTVHSLSNNYKEEGIHLKHKLVATEIPVSADSVVVLTFVQSSG